jgi:uncharacterized protein YbaR (Trm112 family)
MAVLSDQLLAVLACPKSKRPLVYFPRGERDDDEATGFLLCPASRLKYRIEAGVPVLLVEEAETLEARECERLLARARELGLRVS